MNFAGDILQWHKTVDRRLPWKESNDPYNIWISEIVLQQTRVEQGTQYYHRLITHFPSIESLASAEEDEIMRQWKGLGYYSRARNMHKTAKIIVDEYAGRFPDIHSEILSLPGIGPYTAAAIASFAFDLPYAVLDGNVFRVLSRVFGIFTPINTTAGKKEFGKLAADLLPHEQSADYNQAIMDFGALCCKPRKPNCKSCTLLKCCSAYNNNLIDQLPQKEKKLKRRSRYFIGLVCTSKRGLLIEKRTKKDVWQGLYSIPMLELGGKTTRKAMSEQVMSKFPDRNISHVATRTQKLTHQDIYIDLFQVDQTALDESEIVVSPESYDNYAYPRVIDEYIKDYLGVFQND